MSLCIVTFRSPQFSSTARRVMTVSNSRKPAATQLLCLVVQAHFQRLPAARLRQTGGAWVRRLMKRETLKRKSVESASPPSTGLAGFRGSLRDPLRSTPGQHIEAGGVARLVILDAVAPAKPRPDGKRLAYPQSAPARRNGDAAKSPPVHAEQIRGAVILQVEHAVSFFDHRMSYTSPATYCSKQSVTPPFVPCRGKTLPSASACASASHSRYGPAQTGVLPSIHSKLSQKHQ